MAQIRFFATRADLVAATEAFERTGAFNYVKKGRFNNTKYQSYEHAVNIPNLGISTAETSSASDSYLVLCRERLLVGRPLGDGYCIDQLLNPDTVVFTPGGLWGENVLLQGVLGTASASAQSKVLMKRLGSAIKKKYSKIGTSWIGPEARSFLESGKRLTIAVQSPPEFDLISEPR